MKELRELGCDGHTAVVASLKEQKMIPLRKRLGILVIAAT
jgi:hypothetical protein